MRDRSRLGAATIAGVLALALLATPRAGDACAPAPHLGQEVVSADQTALIIWDAAKGVEHFVRQASSKNSGNDFGFIVPSPGQPELAEADPAAFTQLAAITAPEVIQQPRPQPQQRGGWSCNFCASGSAPGAMAPPADAVRVLDQKLVAGYDATVLEADSAKVLTEWLKANGYAYSPEIAAWATPYLEQKWKFTALKVAPTATPQASGPATVTAKALRISFATKVPLFPYKEPDPTAVAQKLAAGSRFLRVYFVAESRYEWSLGQSQPWAGRTAWAGAMTAESRAKLLATLKLPESTGPAAFHLTEFEEGNRLYRPAAADVTFAPSADPSPVKRRPIVEYVRGPRAPDAAGVALGVAVLAALGLRGLRRR